MDESLKIQTTGIERYYSDYHHNRYEPTDYRILDLLIQNGYIHKEINLIDYGSGKGRVSLYLSYKTKCLSMGIEYNYEMVCRALENVKNSQIENVFFTHVDASDYVIDNKYNCFYFFNPFSIQILKKVMNQILTSYYDCYREMTFIFYYPSDEYISYLMSINEIICNEIIDVHELFDTNDEQEKVYIFTTY